MTEETSGELLLSGFKRSGNPKSPYEKWTQHCKFSAHPVPGKRYWTLLIDNYNGHIESYTFQQVMHLIDYSNRHLSSVQKVGEQS